MRTSHQIYSVNFFLDLQVGVTSTLPVHSIQAAPQFAKSSQEDELVHIKIPLRLCEGEVFLAWFLQVLASWREKLTSPETSGKNSFLESRSALSPLISVGNEDMQFLEWFQGILIKESILMKLWELRGITRRLWDLKDEVLHAPRLGNSSPKGFLGGRTSTWVQVQIGHWVRNPSRALIQEVPELKIIRGGKEWEKVNMWPVLVASAYDF